MRALLSAHHKWKLWSARHGLVENTHKTLALAQTYQRRMAPVSVQVTEHLQRTRVIRKITCGWWLNSIPPSIVNQFFLDFRKKSKVHKLASKFLRMPFDDRFFEQFHGLATKFESIGPFVLTRPWNIVVDAAAMNLWTSRRQKPTAEKTVDGPERMKATMPQSPQVWRARYGDDPSLSMQHGAGVWRRNSQCAVERFQFDGTLCLRSQT